MKDRAKKKSLPSARSDRPAKASPLTLAIVGAKGRMGQAVAKYATSVGFSHVIAIDVKDSLAQALKGASVVIDFSSNEGTRALAEVAKKKRIPLVIGTTGIEPETRKLLEAAARVSPVFIATNMSYGVYVLGVLAEKARELLGDAFDVEIVEVHHKLKIDAPSGTALTLATKLRAPQLRAVNGRAGKPGARPATDLGFHAVRGGDVIGDHTLHFLGAGERLELTHRATSRDLFAMGALRAAKAIVSFGPGTYGMDDIAGGN